MAMGMSLSLGLGGRRRLGASPSEQLLLTADHYWNAEDWSGSGAWVARAGGVDATLYNASKVAVGETYNTDKTADRELVWLNGTNAYVDLGASTVIDFGDASSSTVAMSLKVFAPTASFRRIYTSRQLAGTSTYPGLQIYFNATTMNLVAELDKGAATVIAPNRAVTADTWETAVATLSPTLVSGYTSTAAAFTTVARSTGFEVPASPVHYVGRDSTTGYQAMALEWVAIWQAGALDIADVGVLEGS